MKIWHVTTNILIFFKIEIIDLFGSLSFLTLLN